MNTGRLIIRIESPVLLQDPALDRDKAVSTLRDWDNGMPYIPAGVIMSALKESSEMLRNIGQGEVIDRVLGTDSTAGLLWIGHAYFNGIRPAALTSMRNQLLFGDDIYEALTEEVELWYGNRSVTGRAIAAGTDFMADFKWLGPADEKALKCLSACCAGIGLIGENTGAGLGRVSVMPEDNEFTEEDMDFLGG